MATSPTPIALAILDEGDTDGHAMLQRVRESSRGCIGWTYGMNHARSLEFFNRIGRIR